MQPRIYTAYRSACTSYRVLLLANSVLRHGKRNFELFGQLRPRHFVRQLAFIPMGVAAARLVSKVPASRYGLHTLLNPNDEPAPEPDLGHLNWAVLLVKTDLIIGIPGMAEQDEQMFRAGAVTPQSMLKGNLLAAGSLILRGHNLGTGAVMLLTGLWYSRSHRRFGYTDAVLDHAALEIIASTVLLINALIKRSPKATAYLEAKRKAIQDSMAA
jgi:hypothetical protein